MDQQGYAELGLSIVDEIAEEHGASLKFQRAAEGVLQATIAFPVSVDPEMWYRGRRFLPSKNCPELLAFLLP